MNGNIICEQKKTRGQKEIQVVKELNDTICCCDDVSDQLDNTVCIHLNDFEFCLSILQKYKKKILFEWVSKKAATVAAGAAAATKKTKSKRK